MNLAQGAALGKPPSPRREPLQHAPRASPGAYLLFDYVGWLGDTIAPTRARCGRAHLRLQAAVCGPYGTNVLRGEKTPAKRLPIRGSVAAHPSEVGPRSAWPEV